MACPTTVFEQLILYLIYDILHNVSIGNIITRQQLIPLCFFNLVSNSYTFLYHCLLLQVWVIGDFLSPSFDSRCTPDLIVSMYECVETLCYELTGRGRLNDRPISPRLYSMLMSSIAKVSIKVYFST